MKLEITDNKILQAADAVQILIDLEFQKVADAPLPRSPLAQAGLRNGRDVVADYLHHGEAGLALEHLAYMVYETEVLITETTKVQIIDAAIAMGMDEIHRKISS